MSAIRAIGRLIVAVALVSLLVAGSAIACDGDELAQFVVASWDRCSRKDATLVFTGHVSRDGDRTFVKLSREDQQRLYAMLQQRFGKDGAK